MGNKDGQLWRVENNKCNVDGLIKKIKGRRAGYRAVDTQEKTNYEKRYVNGVTNGSQGQFPW